MVATELPAGAPMAPEALAKSTLIRTLADVLGDFSDLVAKQIQLARAEISANISNGILSSIWLGLAALLFLLSGVLVLEAAVFAIASAGIALYWACLMVAAVLAAIGGGVLLYARSAARDTLTPSHSIRQMNKDISAAEGAPRMNRDQEADIYGQAADWLVGTAKRNPEALLVLAAGCALLLRGGGRSRRNIAATIIGVMIIAADYRGKGYVEEATRAAGKATQLASDAAGAAAQYATDIKDRVVEAAGTYASSAAETARSYASTVADYASDAGRGVVSQTSRLADQASNLADQAGSAIGSGAGSVMREQPLAVAVLGVAAGAAIAAFFPSTDIEQRTLRPARDAVADAAARLGENLKEAAGEAGERLQQSAADRGLSIDGVKQMAKEVGETFTNKMSGKPEEPKRPSPASAAREVQVCLQQPNDPRNIMTSGELNRLEREVEEARHRLTADLDRLRAPDTFSSFKDDLVSEARNAKDEWIGKTRMRRRTARSA